MPRISRTSVRFDVDGKTYLASFSHQHFEPPKKVDGLKLKHITKCSLYGDCSLRGNSALLAEGEARCSRKDVYTWLYGIRIAFDFAVIDHLCRDIEESEGDTHKVWIAGKSYLIPGDKRELWGKFHKVFFTEMRKAPANGVG